MREHHVFIVEVKEQRILAKKIIPYPNYNAVMHDSHFMLIKLSQTAVWLCLFVFILPVCAAYTFGICIGEKTGAWVGGIRSMEVRQK